MALVWTVFPLFLNLRLKKGVGWGKKGKSGLREVMGGMGVEG